MQIKEDNDSFVIIKQFLKALNQEKKLLCDMYCI